MTDPIFLRSPISRSRTSVSSRSNTEVGSSRITNGDASTISSTRSALAISTICRSTNDRSPTMARGSTFACTRARVSAASRLRMRQR